MTGHPASDSFEKLNHTERDAVLLDSSCASNAPFLLQYARAHSSLSPPDNSVRVNA